MLKIPQIGQRPKQSDFCVSKDDIDKYLVAKKNFEVDKRRREEKKIALILCPIISDNFCNSSNNIHIDRTYE